MNKQGRIIVFSAPSGSGKSTIINHIIPLIPNLHFSVSATSRAPRGTEQHGKEYYFLTPEEFREKIEEDAFVEYEEVYHDKFYGTLKSEIQRQIDQGRNVVLDIDVKGALNVKKLYNHQAFLIFIQPPSIATLHERLINRGTDSEDIINDRIKKAEYELTFSSHFDTVIINDVLETAQNEVLIAIRNFLD